MKHNNSPVPVLFIPLLLMFSCTQSPLFLYISNEYPPIEPAIGGSPSRIVEHDGKLYVNNSAAVYECDPTTTTPYKWEWFAAPGKVYMLASTAPTGGDLYALGWPYSPDAGKIWKHNGSEFVVEPITTPFDAEPQQIYGLNDGTNGVLFIGTPNHIYSWNGTTLTDLGSAGALLQGAVYDGTNYYLGTYGRGIYELSSAITPLSSATDHHLPNETIKGMILLKDGDVMAVSTGGIYYDRDITMPVGFFSGYKGFSGLSGAIALWDDGTDEMLLLGLEKSTSGSTYPYGYRELDVDSGTGTPKWSNYLEVPGTTVSGSRPTSINPDTKATSAIGNNPVTSIYASSTVKNPIDNRPLIFASTQMRGLWSYRGRPYTTGDLQWNGEDNK
jgi:hypothetical protein